MSIAAVNATTSETVIIANGYKRKLMIIQNVSDTDIYLKMDESATALTTANGYKLTSGSTLLLTMEWGEFSQDIKAIHGGAGNKELRITINE